MARRTVQKGKKIGVNKRRLTFPCMKAVQSDYNIYFFKMKASLAWNIFSISRKEPDSNKGYQRFLSESRVASVAQYIEKGNPIPVSILVALDEATFNEKKGRIRRIEDGNASWGVADAYHASMQLMKAILAAFGVFICRIHNRNVVVDTFPWSGRHDDQKRFRQKYKDWRTRAAIITCITKNVEQSDLFTLFQRVLNVSTVPTEMWPEVIVRNLINTPKTHFSSSRNKLIYGSRFWFLQSDLLAEGLSLKWSLEPKRDMLRYDFAKDGDSTEIDCYLDCWVLFLLCRRLHESLYRGLYDPIGVFGYVDLRPEYTRTVERQFSSGF